MISNDECPNCSSKDNFIEHVSVADFFFNSNETKNLFRCNSCGLIFQDTSEVPKDLSIYYHNYYTHFESSKRNSFKDYFPLNVESLIDEYLQGTDSALNILDYGCGDGQFLCLLKAKGNIRAYGCEADTFLIEKLSCDKHKIGAIDIFDINDYDLFIKSLALKFRIVFMRHVIEHLEDVNSVLSTIYSSLDSNSVLIVSTPNSNSITYKIFGRFWRGLEQPRHLSIFNSDNLSAKLLSIGFDSICTMKGSSMDYPVLYASYVAYIRNNLHFLNIRMLNHMVCRFLYFCHFIYTSIFKNTNEEIILCALKR